MKQFLVRRVLPRVLTVARAVLPRRPHVFVVGHPPTEGNAVETVRALLRRYAGTVVWADAPPASYLDRIGVTVPPAESGGPTGPRAGSRGRPAALRRVRKGSPLTLLRYATAELVLFTHGIYGEPAATARKPTVNLWHGAGIKWAGPLFPQRRLRSRPCDVIVAPSRLWGGRTAEFCGLSDADTLLTGYPRNDELFRPTPADRLSRLGIDGDFVVWLPSYRNTRAMGTMPAIHDGVDRAGDVALTAAFAAVVEVLAEHDVRVVVKPHPLDAVARAVPGAVAVSDQDLADHGITLYGLLGAARGLVSDTSSAWTDFLLVDRPIGFFFPDREQYASGRGVFPDDVLDWLPGPLLDTPDEVHAFARALHAEPAADRERRAAVAERAGLVHTRTAADDLLTALRERHPQLAGRITDAAS